MSSEKLRWNLVFDWRQSVFDQLRSDSINIFANIAWPFKAILEFFLKLLLKNNIREFWV